MILHARSIGDDVQIRHNTTFGVARVPTSNLGAPHDRRPRRHRVRGVHPGRRGRSVPTALIGANAVVLDRRPRRGPPPSASPPASSAATGASGGGIDVREPAGEALKTDAP